MKVYVAPTFAEAYADSLYELLNNPMFETAPRGMPVKENLDVALVIDNPYECMFKNSRRSTQQKYIAAEFLWYYLGRNDAEYITPYAKMWSSIANPDGTVNSAYGNLIFNTKNEHGVSQYEWAYSSLVNDMNTRQAVLHFNMPKHQYDTNKDFVCTMYGNFHIRNNKLNFRVNMRSNDAILGTPTDVPFFCSLQIQMLEHLKSFYPNLEMGTYTHVADSYHIYERHFNLVNEMLENKFESIKIREIKNDLVLSNGKPSRELIWVNEMITGTFPDTLVFQDTNDILYWIFETLTKTTDESNSK